MIPPAPPLGSLHVLCTVLLCHRASAGRCCRILLVLVPLLSSLDRVWADVLFLPRRGGEGFDWVFHAVAICFPVLNLGCRVVVEQSSPLGL